MNGKDIPIVCTLNDAEFHERERAVIQKLMPSVLETVETAEGYAYHFPSEGDSLANLGEFIILERQCCPFLDFKLTALRGNGDIWLELSGPPGAKEFIASVFNK
jgi:hypothetical protein